MRKVRVKLALKFRVKFASIPRKKCGSSSGQVQVKFASKVRVKFV